MMKTQLLKNCIKLIVLALVLIGYESKAQEDFVPVDTVLLMDPSMFIPADTGYFIQGVDVDKVGDDGITEHYEGCYDAYGDSDHKEDGTQNGWYYENVIIFSGCATDAETVDDVIKGTPPASDPDWPTVGNIIQVTKHKFALTDSATYGYIESPSFTNLKSITVKVSTDLSLNGRNIFMLIEASKDGGETWEFVDNDGGSFIHELMTNQGGDNFVYDAEGGDEGFLSIKTLSESGPIKLRFMPFPAIPKTSPTENGERLKFWQIKIEAQTAPEEDGGEEVLSNDLIEENPFFIKNGQFIANANQELFVYRLSGALVGKGKAVDIPSDKGLFVVKTSNGFVQKIFVK